MAQDTSIVNTAAAETAGPIFEGFFAFFGGMLIAFFSCW